MDSCNALYHSDMSTGVQVVKSVGQEVSGKAEVRHRTGVLSPCLNLTEHTGHLENILCRPG